MNKLLHSVILIVNALDILTVGTVQIFWPDVFDKAFAEGNLVINFISAIAAGFGIIYNPIPLSKDSDKEISND